MSEKASPSIAQVESQSHITENKQSNELSLQSKVGQVLYEAAQASLEDAGTEPAEHSASAQRRFKEVKRTVGQVANANSTSEQPLSEQELSAKLKDESVTLKPGYGPIKKAMEVVVALRNNKQYPRLQPLVEQLLTQQEEPTVDQITGFIEQENIQIPNLSTEALLTAIINARTEETEFTAHINQTPTLDSPPPPEAPAAPTVEADQEASSTESDQDREVQAARMHELVDRYESGQLTRDELLLLLATEEADNSPTQQSPESEIIPPSRRLTLNEVNSNTPEQSTEEITAQELSDRYTQIAKKLQAGRLTIDAALDLVRNEKAALPEHKRRTTIQQIERFATWSATVIERNMGSMYDEEPKTKAEAQDRVNAWRKVKAIYAETQRKTRDAYSFAVRQARAFDAALVGELQSLGTDMMQGSAKLAERSAQTLSAKIAGEQPSSLNQEPIQNAPRRTHAQRVRAGLAAVKNVAQQFDEAIVNEIRALGADTAKATIRGTEKAAEKMGSYADRISAFTEDQMRKHEAALAQEKAAKQQKLEAQAAQEHATQQRLLVVELLKQAAAQLDAGNLTSEEARSAVLLEDSDRLAPSTVESSNQEATVDPTDTNTHQPEFVEEMNKRIAEAGEQLALQFSYRYMKLDKEHGEPKLNPESDEVINRLPGDEVFAEFAKKHSITESYMQEFRNEVYRQLFRNRDAIVNNEQLRTTLQQTAQQLTADGAPKVTRQRVQSALSRTPREMYKNTIQENMAVAYVEVLCQEIEQKKKAAATENTTDSTASDNTQQEAAPADEPQPESTKAGKRWNFGLGSLFGKKNDAA